MIMKVFKNNYAKYYDALYQDKNYEREVAYIQKILSHHTVRPVQKLLDCGCGTGGHVIPLAKEGYEITGIDASSAMIATAREKAQCAGVSPMLKTCDIRKFNLKEKYDAALCMFAVLGYITKNDDLLRTFVTIKKHLKENALFIFDFWNGLAVMHILPEDRQKTVIKDGQTIVRTVHPELDSFHHLCHTHYHLTVTEGKRKIVDFTETHTIRYFFPQEIIHYLSDAGFKTINIYPFKRLSGKVDENVWNITVIARASEGNI